ncbi:MAG TPA: pseudouridine synthase [Roseiarcus sp.]|jgi:23S rRNA pseudouridine2605 synthase
MSDNETQAEVSEVRPGQRIAKVMARAGICSRRDAEAWIAEGRVTVNGKALASPAFNVSEDDDVRVDGKRLGAPERTRLFLFHKPKGIVTTARDPEGRPTVFARLPPDLPRLVAIGRLDINTEGLLLLTNDGGLARVLELPSTGWLRRYRVRAHGSIDQTALDRLSDGVAIDGVDYRGVEAKLDREQGSNAWLTLGLREGKNREIKKILEHLGLAVNRLIRLSFGPFELGDLPEGEVMEVRTRVLRDQLGVKLAKEANANFDADLSVRDEPAPERGEGERPRESRGPREIRGRAPAQGRPDRGAGGESRRFERDVPPRRAPPKPSTPERRRKHVSALRAEIAADVSGGKGPRKRIERSATQDRKGRSVAVERISLTGEEARKRAAPETQRKRSGRPSAGERGGRAFEPGARFGRSDSFGPKRGGGEGRERAPPSDRTESAHRPERASAGRRDGRPPERRFDRSAAKGAGERGERKFEQPENRPRTQAGEGRPPRSEHRDSGHRPERPNGGRRDGRPPERRFDRSAAKSDGDRRDRPPRTRDGADPARERRFERPKGQTRPPAGEGRPPRSDARSGGPRPDFKSRPPRTGARDGDTPRSAGRGPGGEGGPPRGRSSPSGRPRPPGKGSPKGDGGPRRPPRKP